MKKFLVIYYAPAMAEEAMADISPEEMQENMKPWMDWATRSGDGLVDMGAPLGNGISVSEGGAPSTKEVSGYSMLQAENLDAAHAMLKGHPHFDYGEGCDIEVYEMMPLPGM